MRRHYYSTMAHVRIRSAWVVILLPVLGTLSGCATYHARRLHPEQFYSNFMSRNLNAPATIAFVRKQKVALPANFPASWNAAALVCAGWYYSPAMRVQRDRVAVDRGNLLAAGEAPNPSVSWSPTYAAKSPPGVSPWILGFNFDIPIETAGRRTDRVARAQALEQADIFTLGSIAWKVRRRIYAALTGWESRKRELYLLTRQAHTAAQLQTLIQNRFSAGDLSRPVYTQAVIQRRELQFQVIKVRGRLHQARLALAAAMSVPYRAIRGLAVSGHNFDRLPAISTVAVGRLCRAALVNRMDIQRLLAEYRAAAAELKLQIARQYPNIHLGPGYSFNQGANEFTLGFNMSLPIFNQNGGAIAAADARRRLVGSQLLQEQSRIISRIKRRLAAYRSSLRLWRSARGVRREYRRQLEAAQRAAAAGAASSLTVAEAEFSYQTFAIGAIKARFAAAESLESLANALEVPPAVLTRKRKGNAR